MENLTQRQFIGSFIFFFAQEQIACVKKHVKNRKGQAIDKTLDKQDD
jgi:hypothetical protein